MRKKVLYSILAIPLLVIFVLLLLGSVSPVLTKTVAEVEIALPQNKTWERLMDFSSYPKWRREVASVDKLNTSAAPLAWKEIFQDHSETKWELIDARPPDFIVLNRVVRNANENERWIFMLSTKGDKTVVRVEIREALLSPIKRAVVQLRNLFINPAGQYLKSLAVGI